MKREHLKIYSIITISFMIISTSLYFTFKPKNKLYIKSLTPAEFTQLQPKFINARSIQTYSDEVWLLDNIIQQCEQVAYQLPRNIEPNYQFIIDNTQQNLSIAFFINQQEKTITLIQNNQLKSQTMSKTQARFYQCPYMDTKESLQSLNLLE